MFSCFVFINSYAEMETKAKNAISHRGRALEKLRAYLGRGDIRLQEVFPTERKKESEL